MVIQIHRRFSIFTIISKQKTSVYYAGHNLSLDMNSNIIVQMGDNRDPDDIGFFLA